MFNTLFILVYNLFVYLISFIYMMSIIYMMNIISI